MKFALTFAALCLFHLRQSSGAITTHEMQAIAEHDNNEHYENALRNILVPRVVGTQGWKDVQDFIINELRSMDMKVELDSFVDNTPTFGKLNFVNIIGKLNPNADRFLVLSAHYDSKYFPNGAFLGATDSAVPCALMLNLVKTTLPLLKRILEGTNLGLMLIFFDGEEAFVNWTDDDSLYGSRHLAKKWELQNYKNEREIDRINVLVLLDLIGSTDASFMCTFKNTCVLNKRLGEIEDALLNFSSLRRVPNGPANTFLNSYRASATSDDHLPFLHRKVPILHLIPKSFPKVWHTLADDGRHLNQRSILNFNKIMRVFIVEYLSDCVRNPLASKCRLK